MHRLIFLTVTALGLFSTGAVARSPKAPRFERDIVYGKADGEDELRLDFVRPVSGAGPFPLVVWFHGGGFRIGDRKNNHSAMLGLAKLGYAGASVQYRFAPRHKFPAQLDDARMALAFLRANAKRFAIDPDRIALAGGSAGGNLALLLAMMPGKDGRRVAGVRAVVNYFGPTDLARLKTDAGTNALLRKIVGRDLDGMIDDYLGTSDRGAPVVHRASPITYVGPTNPPVLTIQGSADTLVPLQQAKDLHQALRKAEVPEKLVVIEGAGHDIESWNARQQEKANKALLAFLKKYLKPNP
jgi:acetyl esterase/lipase